MDTHTKNHKPKIAGKPAVQKIFVPVPQKIRIHPPSPGVPSNADLTEQLALARRQACQEMLGTLEEAINDPMQAMLSMAELERRDDYRKLIEQVLATIRKLQMETFQ